jgi:hypothetical protein
MVLMVWKFAEHVAPSSFAGCLSYLAVDPDVVASGAVQTGVT